MLGVCSSAHLSMTEETVSSSQAEAIPPKAKRRASVKQRWDKIRAAVLNPEGARANQRRNTLNVTDTDITSDLLKTQTDWADLLMHDDIQIFKPLKCTGLDRDQQCIVAASWFNDAVLGWRIDYPQNATQLKCYIFTRSRRFLQIYTVCFFLHMLTPFLGEPDCPWADFADGRTAKLFDNDHGRYMSRFLINFIGFLCVLLYCLEISMRLYVNNKIQSTQTNVLPWYKDNWIFIRLVCCIVLLVDICTFIFTQTPVRFGRALLPFIYISRRNSLRQMFQGLWLAFLNSFGILSFLFAAVLLWTFGGFILFRGVDVTSYSEIYENLYVNITDAQEEHLNRFDTPYEAFLTSLYSATSRSYNILVLNPYFEVTAASTVYFVALTIVADLIILNLMIAFGNRQYRIFAAKLFKRQLRNRRQALVSIHSILCDDNGNIDRKTWLDFCSNCQGKYAITQKVADTIFTLECENDPYKSNFDTIDCLGLFRLAALLCSRVKIDVDKLKDNGKSLSPGNGDRADAHEHEQKANGKEKALTSGHAKSNTYDADAHAPPLHATNPMHAKSSSVGESAPTTTAQTTKMSSLSRFFLHASPEDENSDDELEKRALSRSKQTEQVEAKDSELVELDLDELKSASSNATSLSKKWHYFLRFQATRLIRWKVTISTPPVPYLWPHAEKFQIEPFHIFYVLVKILLVVQCGVISSDNSGISVWIKVGWVIMGLLWGEMLVKLLAWGRRLYLRRTGFGYTAIINIVTTILMITLGSNSINYSSAAFILYMILQSSRLLLLFRFLADSDAFLSLVPLVYRIFFIIFSIFYVFAVIGYTRLCNVFRESNIEDDAVDDANTWLNFQKMFNFDSLLHTMYTCFYVTTLGNWTWIMNAAAQTEPFLSLLFFTSIRFLFTLAIYPILFSFLITAYIARRNKDERAKGINSNDLKGLENKLMEFDSEQPEEMTFKFEKLQTLHETPQDITDALHRAVRAVHHKRSGETDREDSESSSGSSGFAALERGDEFEQAGGGHRKIKSVVKLWLSQDKLTVREMFDSYSNGSLMNEGDKDKPTESKRDSLMSKKKHESMMSHWSGGQEALTAGEKAKKKKEILEKLLEITMESIASERSTIKDMEAEMSSLRRAF